MKISENSRIAVCGAGVMGRGIAQVAAAAGHEVVVFDRSEDAIAKGGTGIAKSIEHQLGRGKINSQDAEALLARITWSDDISVLFGVSLLIEAIIESAEAKIDLFADAAAVVGPDCVLASNTSSLSIQNLAASIPMPERFLGLHFFNPVPAMKLVEVIPASETSPSLTDEISDLMERWGKKPARVRDVPGFIVNRVARPYYSEAFSALGDGMAAEAIDTLLESAGRFRMGALTLTDLIGQDINYSVAAGVFESYGGKVRFRPQLAQRALAENGKLGRKSGEGVYCYPEGRGEATAVVPAGELGAVTIASRPGAMLPIADALSEAGLVLSIDESLPEGILCAGGIRIAMGDGRPLKWRGDGVAVLIDHVRNVENAPSIGATAENLADLGIIAALFVRLGKAVIAVPDRPGQLVLRTLAQLANAAADAVADEVASAADIDMAMQFGANHPEGPLAWAERFGTASLASVLANIASATKEAMYLPAREFEGVEV